ncbi:unnamed protein product [Amoebophrya sp. A120]|nr:unnamed protein product [Amoebophrya sp. A120]|eukprot:GSA120T00007463001.1
MSSSGNTAARSGPAGNTTTASKRPSTKSTSAQPMMRRRKTRGTSGILRTRSRPGLSSRDKTYSSTPSLSTTGARKCFPLVYVADLIVILTAGRELARQRDESEPATDYPMRFLAFTHCISSFATHWFLNWPDNRSGAKISSLLRLVCLVFAIIFMTYSAQSSALFCGMLAVIVNVVAVAMICKLYLRPDEMHEDFDGNAYGLEDGDFNRRSRTSRRKSEKIKGRDELGQPGSKITGKTRRGGISNEESSSR